ncbi:MAG: hypothetical protein NTV34_19190, partial [Proteobacteria bacterium]|nr:hypothetical protein [Pseudomonadota bacterium]
IDITAVLNRINPDGLAISGSIPQQISKSFKLTLDPGRIRRQWSIQLDTSPNQSGSAVAIFVEAPKEVNLSPNATRIAVPIEVQDSNMRQKNDSQEVAK